MKRYKSIIQIIYIVPLFLSACLFPADRDNPNDYKNLKSEWSKPVQISNMGDPWDACDRLSLGMSSDGTAIAAWRQRKADINKYRIFVNKIHANYSTTWEGLIQIDGAPEQTECDLPQVAVNQYTNAVIAWTESDSGTNYIWARSYDNQDWTSANWIELPGGPVTSTTNTCKNLSIAMNDSLVGAVVAWYEDTLGIYGAAYMSSVDSLWHMDSLIATTDWPVAGITNGYATTVVAYNAGSPEWYLHGYFVELNSYIGDAWDINYIYDGNTAGNKKPLYTELDIDVDGNGIYVWCLEGNNYLYANTTIPNDFSDANNSIANTQVQITNSPALMPKVVLNKYGDSKKAVIVYKTGDNHLKAAMLSFNDDMSIIPDFPIIPIDNPDGGECKGHDIAIDASGNAVAVWVQDTRLWANRLDVTTEEWSKPVIIDSGVSVDFENTEYLRYRPRVAMSADGYAVVTWLENSHVYARVHKP